MRNRKTRTRACKCLIILVLVCRCVFHWNMWFRLFVTTKRQPIHGYWKELTKKSEETTRIQVFRFSYAISETKLLSKKFHQQSSDTEHTCPPTSTYTHIPHPYQNDTFTEFHQNFLLINGIVARKINAETKLTEKKETFMLSLAPFYLCLSFEKTVTSIHYTGFSPSSPP